MLQDTQYFYHYISSFIEQEKEMKEEFSRRAEEARKKYWDAGNLPRKQKKAARKIARADYIFYKQLANHNFCGI